MASTGTLKHAVLNKHLHLVSYNGGALNGNLGVTNVLKLKKREPHCSAPGKNFDLVLEYKVRPFSSLPPASLPFPLPSVFFVRAVNCAPLIPFSIARFHKRSVWHSHRLFSSALLGYNRILPEEKEGASGERSAQRFLSFFPMDKKKKNAFHTT